MKYWLTFNEINCGNIPMGAFMSHGVLNDLENPTPFMDQPDNLQQRFQSQHYMFVASALAVRMAHEIDPACKVGNMIAYFETYPFTCNPDDVLKTQQESHIMNDFCGDVQCRGYYYKPCEALSESFPILWTNKAKFLSEILCPQNDWWDSACGSLNALWLLEREKFR